MSKIVVSNKFKRSFLRNIVSDAHVRTYKPAEHHARLAVNSAKTMCNFLFDTKEYQIAKNKNA